MQSWLTEHDSRPSPARALVDGADVSLEHLLGKGGVKGDRRNDAALLPGECWILVAEAQLISKCRTS